MPKPIRTQEHLNNYIPVPEAGCWIWLGAGGPKGYGTVPLGTKGKKEIASRYFYRHLIGPIPDGMFVCHRCDTPSCVNPAHLFIGTPMDNVRDMFNKGRNKLSSGVHNGRARITIEQVRQARLMKETKMFTSVIARKMGFPRSTIRDIVLNKTWIGEK